MKLIAAQVKVLKGEDQVRGLDAGVIATGYSALIIGQWQQFNVSPGDFHCESAKAICRAAAGSGVRWIRIARTYIRWRGRSYVHERGGQAAERKS